MSHDSNRTRIWFPMFSYFESSVDGIIPNEYDSLDSVFTNIFVWIIFAKDCCMLTARRFWVDAHNQLPPMPKTELSLFGRSLNDLVLSSSPAKRAAAGGGTTVKVPTVEEGAEEEEETVLASAVCAGAVASQLADGERAVVVDGTTKKKD